MATLHVRGIPDLTYNKIKQLADESNRSLSQQVLTLLESALTQQQRLDAQRTLLNEIGLRRTYTGRAKNTADTTLAMLREDRSR